jgi:hypothetical protein
MWEAPHTTKNRKCVQNSEAENPIFWDQSTVCSRRGSGWSRVGSWLAFAKLLSHPWLGLNYSASSLALSASGYR